MERACRTSGRELFLRFLLLVFLSICIGKAFYLAGPGHEKCMQVARTVALETGTIPAMRGRILDAESRPVAWSEKFFDLCFDCRMGCVMSAEQSRLLQHILPRCESVMPLVPSPDGNCKLVARSLSPGELAELEELLKECPALTLKVRVERMFCSGGNMAERIGKLDRTEKHAWHGISGWEREYDELLSGIPGRYEVVLDRHRRWINSSWKQLSAPVPGRDVVLPWTIARLRKEKDLQ